jgi:fructokinase
LSVARDPKIVVGLGEILWDLLPSGKQLGGAPANCAYHANALGAVGVVLSAVGNDALGHKIIDTLYQKGLATAHVSVLDDLDTGTVSVVLNVDGQATYTIHENVAWDQIPMNISTMHLAQSTAAVCFGSLAQRSEISRKSIRDFINNTASDCLCVFDINIRQESIPKEILSESLELATVLKLNDEELPYLAQVFDCDGDEKNQLQQLRSQFNLELVAYTRGAMGSIMLDADEVVEVSGGESIEVADTVGAGDAYTASLIINRLNGESLHIIAQRAHARASLVCTQSGGMPDV